VSHTAASDEHIATLLLAAGRGRRFDVKGARLKLLEPASRGEFVGAPLAVAAARCLRDELGCVHAIVRPATDATQRRLHGLLVEAGCELIVCERAEEGMGISLATGVLATAASSGWIVALADMPAIARATIRAVLDALRDGATCVAPQFGTQRGHPVGFSRICFEDLAALSGDLGARGVLQRHPLQLLTVDDPGCILDIDHPDQLAR
jgi:molybdenum cofactor cytidylyltransferase